MPKPLGLVDQLGNVMPSLVWRHGTLAELYDFKMLVFCRAYGCVLMCDVHEFRRNFGLMASVNNLRY